MINGAEKHGKSQYEGFNYWPKITISCDTCQGDVTLTHSKEGDDRAFCCRKCHIKVKTCRKNAMKDYTILKILRERPDGLPNDEIAYLLGTVHQHRCNPYQISSLLKRWIAYGVVTKEKPSAKSRTIYRLSKEYQNMPGGHVRIFRKSNILKVMQDHNFSFIQSEKYHAFHSAYWWLRCIFWKTQENNFLVKVYKKILERHILKNTPIMDVIEKLLNPILGKSISFYFKKN